MHWTRQWWDEFESQFELLTSPGVILELQQGSTEKTADRLELVSGLELLDITEEIDDIVATYIERLVMPNDPADMQRVADKLIVNHLLPEKAAADARHVAVSTVFG